MRSPAAEPPPRTTGLPQAAARTRFLPSRDGYPFGNDWPAAPALVVRTPLGPVGIGNAARGLCGGMVFAALDHWHAGIPPPAGRPAPGSAHYRFIVRRLIDSWNIPAGVLRYYRWMTLPPGGPAERTTSIWWPRVRAALDRGRPVPLGLVTVASADPLLLGHNHQVAAFCYEISDGTVRLSVYDPNRGPADDVAIIIPAGDRPAEFPHNLGLDRPVRGFFPARYSPVSPPGQAEWRRGGWIGDLRPGGGLLRPDQEAPSGDGIRADRPAAE